MTPDDSADLASRPDDGVVDFMARLAVATEATATTSHLPDARRLWIRSRVTERWEAKCRVDRALALAEPLPYAAAAVAILIVGSWVRPEIENAFRALGNLL